ncbi:hypothetical protein RIMD111065_38510 [Aeromonas hydrophila]|nr:hypothetical protein [Aeromonas hydrophila]BCO15495.1 hypothetical protein RIMD111065_38510 [Aeromonas hydrophila]
MRQVLVIDTSIMCVWLEVPGMESCGPANDIWNHERVTHKIAEAEAAGTLLVLPLATIIETGNHITRHANSFIIAGRLAEKINLSASGQRPWAAFTEQNQLWSDDALIRLAQEWPAQAAANTSIGDATIVNVVNYYLEMGRKVEVLTGDQGLQQQVPQQENTARRHRNR